MDKQELGAFLRSRRERLRPEDVGLPSGSRRRTPGLRREEVAVLAHISTEYYVRLEQGRAPRPSGEVLAGIAGALLLTDAESDHLHVLAGTAPNRSGLHRRDVRPSILALLERLPQSAAFVTSAAFEVLAWNDLAAALMEDFARLAPEDRNLARRAFLGSAPARTTSARADTTSARPDTAPARPDTAPARTDTAPARTDTAPARADTTLYGVTDAAEFRHNVVMGLRLALARYPSDPSASSATAAPSSPGSGNGTTCRLRRRSRRPSATRSSGRSPSTATRSCSRTATSTS
jgi:transcriptional regulator with XRE-family HTH domain